MAFLGFTRVLGPAALIGVGVAAIAIDEVVTERGPGVIIEPAYAVLERLEPTWTIAAERFSKMAAIADDPVAVADVAKPPKRETPAVEEKNLADLGTGALSEAAVPDELTVKSKASDALLAARCDADGEVADPAVRGDRLALRFFEHSTLGLQGAPGAAEANSIVFERLDLSGSYEVGQDGAVSLPAIGHVDVIARSLRCIEHVVSLAARERLRVNTSVSAAFASRPPVLVQGTVRAPGAHSYFPGLTVERVLAQAGAVGPTIPVPVQQIASLRARAAELDTLDAGLLIERARIEAALSDDSDFAADNAAWVIVAQTLGKDRVETERGTLLSELAEEKAHKERNLDRIADLMRRVEAAREHLATVEDHLRHLAARHERIKTLLTKGVVPEGKLEESRLRKMAMERTVLERRDTLLQLEADIKQAQHESDLREAQRRTHLNAKAREISKERTILREQLRAVRMQLDLEDAGTAKTFMVTIQRPKADGLMRFVAELETSVRPGDLVTVASEESAGESDQVPAASLGAVHVPAPVMSASWTNIASGLK